MLDVSNLELVEQELLKPLDPKAIKPAPAGKYGDYVDGYHVVTEANRIFGPLGWSYEIKSLKGCGVWHVTDKNNKPQVRVSYMCVVTARVGDVVREGSAVGHGQRHPDQEGDAHESAVKEAETDALKRALRTLGNTFGLALYEKVEKGQERSQVKDSRTPSELARDRIKDGLVKTPPHIHADVIRKADKFLADYELLEPPHKAEIDTLLKDRAA